MIHETDFKTLIQRTLKLDTKHSAFLFGPRQVGKTSLIKSSTNPDLFVDLLKHDQFLRYAKNPEILRKEVQSLKKDRPLVVVDEIQRCPELLNEAQVLIDSGQRVRFILTGSSARKIKRKGTNMLGGRAITLRLHPFTHEELGEAFSLDDALRFGTLPPVSLESNPQEKARLLKSYVETYLKEEIQQEALTRNVAGFARFFDLAGFENGHVLNFLSLSSQVGIDAKTVRTYFQILEDTLLGFFLLPYAGSHRAKLIQHPKFFFFDCGLVSALQKTLTQELVPGSPPYGKAFEHWIFLETKRLLDYREREYELSFFRTADGAEVDFILKWGKELWAVEIKSSAAPRLSELNSLRNFQRDHLPTRSLCVCRTPRRYQEEEIEFIPWQDFLTQL